MNKIKKFWDSLPRENQLKVIGGIAAIGGGLTAIAEAVLVKNG